MSRRREREGFEVDVRVAMLEKDADKAEDDINGLYREIRRMRNTFLAFVIALATASVMLGINLATGTARATGL